MADALEDIQDRILDRLHAGDPVDRDAILAAHPAHAPALRQFFAVIALLEEPPPVPPVPAPARLGEFRVVREIGRGGMGVVYEAEQPSLKRRVALKVLGPSLRGDPRIIERFHREAEAAGRLRHPNLVAVHSFGTEGETPFFAMELVEGISLANVIEGRGRGESAGAPTHPAAYRAWAVDVIMKIASALEYAHGQGIVHRDVKPGNVVIESDGTPRLTDFGLALDVSATSLTLAGEIFGSPQYMSPEQAFRRATPLDARTDVYSLGVTLYELLTLQLPYEGTTTTEVLAALSVGEIVPPRVRDQGVPEALESVLLRSLRHDPNERYQSVAGFARDLAAAARDGGPAPATRAESPPSEPLAARWAIAAVLIAAAGGVVWLATRGEGTVADPDPPDSDGPARVVVAVDDVATNAAMAAGLTPSGVSLVEFGERSITLEFQYPAGGGNGPLPAACEVDLSMPDRDTVIATARFVSGPGTDAVDGTDNRTVEFVLPDRQTPYIEQVRLGWRAGRPKTVLLAFRPSEGLALAHPGIDRYWGGTHEATVRIRKSGDDPPPMAIRSTPLDLTAEELESLVDGQDPANARLLESWLRLRVLTRPFITLDDLRGSHAHQVEVLTGRGLPELRCGPLELACVWELSADERRTWHPAAAGQVTIVDGDRHWTRAPVAMPEDLVRRTPMHGTDLHYRLTAHLARRPAWMDADRGATAEELRAWRASGTRCTFETVRTLRVRDRYPPNFPHRPQSSDSQAEVRTWLAPRSANVRTASSSQPPDRQDGVRLALDIELPADRPPAPIAAEVELRDPVDRRVLGSPGTFVIDPLTSPSRLQSARRVTLEFEVDAQAASELLQGKRDQVRLVFRSSRRVALDSAEFVSGYAWVGTLEVDVAVRVE